MRKTPRTPTPDGRRLQTLALLGALLLVVTAFAGCTDASAATASQLQLTAQERAERWDVDSELVMILGTEGTFQMQSMLSAFGVGNMDHGMDDALDEEFWQRVEDDPEPGDGRAVFWLYVFRAGDGDSHLVVVVDMEKKVIYDETAQESDIGFPVGDYSIDSHQAVNLALDENEHLKTASEQDQFGFVIGLFREEAEGNPTWIVAGGGGTSESAGGGMVMIDAKTGDVLESEGGSGAPSDWTSGGF